MSQANEKTVERLRSRVFQRVTLPGKTPQLEVILDSVEDENTLFTISQNGQTILVSVDQWQRFERAVELITKG